MFSIWAEGGSFMTAMIQMIAIFSVVLLARSAAGATLSAVDFTSYSTSSDYAVTGNPVGLSFDFEKVLGFVGDKLFQEYMINSNLYGDWSANFFQGYHTPLGYKFNCSLQAALWGAGNYSCAFEMNNDSLIAQLGTLFYDTCMYYGSSMGWDMELANFSNIEYIKQVFYPYMVKQSRAANQPFLLELLDRGDQLAQLGVRSNYSAAQLVQDCNSVNNYMYGVVMLGPGTTAAADASWYSQNQNIYYYCGAFTFRAVAFPDPAQLSIPNLLSETYTSLFLTQRLNVGGVSYVDDLVKYLGSINDLRMVEDEMGVEGLTNSFAACIWAIDIALEFFYLSGYQLQFYNPMLNGSAQNLLGPPPAYAPTPLYSAAMFLNLAVMNYPYVDKAVVSPGLSSSIKIFGLDYRYNYGLVILNKDLNSSRSGEVEVMISDLSGLYCVYLTADHLAATSAVTFGGVAFVGGQAAPVGDYSERFVPVGQNGYYQVPLNYSQVAYCYTKVQESYVYFPQGRRSAELALLPLLLPLLLILAQL